MYFRSGLKKKENNIQITDSPYRLWVSEYIAPPAINSPNIIIINGQNSILMPASDVIPTRIIINPIMSPKIVPP